MPILMDETVEQLRRALTLENVKPQTREIVLSLFSDKYVQFVQIRLYPGRTNRARECVDRLEPSDLFLKLVAAVSANDVDGILAIDHDLRSPNLAEAP